MNTASYTLLLESDHPVGAFFSWFDDIYTPDADQLATYAFPLLLARSNPSLSDVSAHAAPRLFREFLAELRLSPPKFSCVSLAALCGIIDLYLSKRSTPTQWDAFLSEAIRQEQIVRTDCFLTGRNARMEEVRVQMRAKKNRFLEYNLGWLDLRAVELSTCSLATWAAADVDLQINTGFPSTSS